MSKNTSIGIIGAGVMGKAICTSLIRQRIVSPSQLIISDSDCNRLESLRHSLKVTTSNNNLLIVQSATVIIIATKPQEFEKYATEIKGHFSGEQIILSIMAGVSIERISSCLQHKRVVRAMPNLAVQVAEAFTVYKSGFIMDQAESDQVKSILKSFGITVEVLKEKYIDAATAVSGSGPAYVYYFIESLIDAAMELGFSENIARKMIEQTIYGAIELQRATGETAHDLRKKVTSKYGATEAAINSLENSKFNQIVQWTVQQAYKRTRDLSK